MKAKVRRRSGTSLLAVALVVVLVVAILTRVMFERSVGAQRQAGAGRDDLAVRLAAESAIEELVHQVQLTANQPGDPIFDRFRNLGTAGGDGPWPLDLRVPLVDEDLEGSGIRLEVEARIRDRVGSSPDPGETSGTLLLVARAARDGPRGGAFMEVEEHLRFQVSNTAPPPQLAGLLLVVTAQEADPVLGLPAGRMTSARSGGSYRSLMDLLTLPAPDGLSFAPPEVVAGMNTLQASLSPEAMTLRSQFETGSPARLVGYLTGRMEQGLPTSGVFSNVSDQTLELSLSGFTGRCLIRNTGPILVQEVTVADPGQDRLTLVSDAGITVAGRRVDATLVAVNPSSSGVVFQRPAHVRGAIYSTRFPRGQRMSRAELADCRVGDTGFLEPGGPTAYQVVLSPNPTTRIHRRSPS